MISIRCYTNCDSVIDSGLLICAVTSTVVMIPSITMSSLRNLRLNIDVPPTTDLYLKDIVELDLVVNLILGSEILVFRIPLYLP